MAQQPLLGQGLVIVEALQSHSDTPHSVELVWTSDQTTERFLPENTPHSQDTDIYTPVGIRTINSSKRAAADKSLRSPGHWDRLSQNMVIKILLPATLRGNLIG